MEISNGIEIKTQSSENPRIGNFLKWSLVVVQLSSLILLSTHIYLVSSSLIFFDSLLMQKVLYLFYGYQLMTAIGSILMVIYFHKKKFVVIRNAFLIFSAIRLLVNVAFFLKGFSLDLDVSAGFLQLLKVTEIIFYITVIINNSGVGRILKIYAALSLVLTVSESWFTMFGKFEFAFFVSYGYLVMMVVLLIHFILEPVAGDDHDENLLDDFSR